MSVAVLHKAQFVDRLAPDAEWRLVHRLADAAYPSVLRQVSRALVSPEDETTWARVIEALQAGDGNRAAETLNLDALVEQLQTRVSPLIVDVYARAGAIVMRKMVMRLVVKAEIAIGFKSTNPAAREWAEQQSARMITDIVAGTRKAVRVIIGEAFRKQITVRETAKRVRLIVGLMERQALAVEHFRDALEQGGISAPVVARRVEFYAARKLRERAETIARTEIMGASNAGQVEAWRQAREVGAVDSDLVKEWITTPDDRLCDFCEPMDGQQAAVDAAFSGGVMHPPLHPSCIAGESLVSPGGRISAVSKRWFDGEMVVISIAGGRELTCTPNHPILTPTGWVRACGLYVGDDVICDGRRQGRGVVDGDDQDMPSRSIQHITKTFFESGPMVSCPVPVTSEDFHGDGKGSEIAIIGTNVLLRPGVQATVGEQVSQGALLETLDGSAFSDGKRAETQFVPAGMASFRRLMSGSDLGGSLRDVHTSPFQALTLGLCSDADSRFTQSTINRTTTDRELARELIHGHAIPVFSDQIIYIKQFTFHGYVFNLETEQGWFGAEGIITHNCRCAVGLNPPRHA